MKPLNPLYLIATWALIAFVVYNEDKRHDLLTARIECESTQIPNIIEYEQRQKDGTWPAAVDPPSNYCLYLQAEHPDVLLRYLPSNT